MSSSPSVADPTADLGPSPAVNPAADLKSDPESHYSRLLQKSPEHRAFGEFIADRLQLYADLQIPTPQNCDVEERLERSCDLIRRIGSTDLQIVQGFRFGLRRPSQTIATGKILRILVLIEAFRQRTLDIRDKAYWKPFYVVTASEEDQELIAKQLRIRDFSVVTDTRTPTWTQSDYAVLSVDQAFRTRLWIRQETAFVFVGYARDLFGLDDEQDLPNRKQITEPEKSAEDWFMHRFLVGNVLEIQPV